MALTALRAICRLSAALTAALDGRTREDAVYALAAAYRSFVQTSPGLYQLILRIPMSGDGTLTAALPEMIEPIFSLLGQFDLSKEEMNY